MGRSDKTSMGGSKSSFQTTDWSVVRSARTPDQARQRVIIDNLIRKYWKPVYCYLRRKGYDNESAKDLTQGFFHELVLGRHLFQLADETRGRFRTFLLTALDRYVTDVYRSEVRQKRHPKDRIIPLGDLSDVFLFSDEMKPDETFTYVWASALLDVVLTEVKQSCSRDGKGIYWDVFRAKVLGPIMSGSEPQPLSKLCEQLGIDSESKASNMILTVKRRLQGAMRRRIRQHVNSDEEIEREIYELIKILSKDPAR